MTLHSYVSTHTAVPAIRLHDIQQASGDGLAYSPSPEVWSQQTSELFIDVEQEELDT